MEQMPGGISRGLLKEEEAYSALNPHVSPPHRRKMGNCIILLLASKKCLRFHDILAPVIASARMAVAQNRAIKQWNNSAVRQSDMNAAVCHGCLPVQSLVQVVYIFIKNQPAL